MTAKGPSIESASGVGRLLPAGVDIVIIKAMNLRVSTGAESALVFDNITGEILLDSVNPLGFDRVSVRWAWH